MARAAPLSSRRRAAAPAKSRPLLPGCPSNQPRGARRLASTRICRNRLTVRAGAKPQTRRASAASLGTAAIRVCASPQLGGLRAKTSCRSVKFCREHVLCRQRAEDQAPRAKFAQPGYRGPRRLVYSGERAGSAARHFSLLGPRHRLARAVRQATDRAKNPADAILWCCGSGLPIRGHRDQLRAGLGSRSVRAR